MKSPIIVLLALPLLGFAIEAKSAALGPADEAEPAAIVSPVEPSRRAPDRELLEGIDFRLAGPLAVGGPDDSMFEDLPVHTNPNRSEEDSSVHRISNEDIEHQNDHPTLRLNFITIPF